MPKSMQRVRTFILLLLQRGDLVQREKLDRLFGGEVLSDKILVLLKQVAKKTEKGWMLRIEEDYGFRTHHPEQVTRHEQYWEKQEDWFRKELGLIS
jgi:hypothetical protein